MELIVAIILNLADNNNDHNKNNTANVNVELIMKVLGKATRRFKATNKHGH